ncbi:MAG: UDP-N-acetylglucosamine 2-epimerase (non-hydrolyzing) [Bacteroidetes bacterium]|nr:UDP-N-acetylglucosamine 2-epimerase (non-hydrolyzing) [Bacteroidota bacterium]
MKKILFVIGTRPEAIKLASLFHVLSDTGSEFSVEVCTTGQHQEMMSQTLDFFNIKPNYNLELMKKNQSLFDISSSGIKNIEAILDRSNPDLVVVQGDTTSAFVGAIGAFYKHIKVAHIEAGLRTHNKFAPFPEEINRKLVGHIADFHFAPTEKAKENLKLENISENVWVVGNTVIDSLFLTLNIIKQNKTCELEIINYFKQILGEDHNLIDSKIIFVTAHRRESFGKPFYEICTALRTIAEKYPQSKIVYPVHLNPNVRGPVFEKLNGISNIFLIDPLDYPKTIWLMQQAHIVLTDSGGIQEEAPSLGKPVLVMRDVTERVEGVEAGTAKLVGSDQAKICQEVEDLMENNENYEKVSRTSNPYGDGKACQRIADLLTLI